MSFTRLERRDPPSLAPSGGTFSHFAPHKSKEMRAAATMAVAALGWLQLHRSGCGLYAQ